MSDLRQITIAVFAVFAAYVFWGTWSPDYAPVMPDDSVCHPLAFSDQFAGFVRGFLNGEEFSPTKIFWNGALPMYAVQEFKYAVSLYLAGLALSFFLRERGLSRTASYGAGLLLGFCGYRMTLFSMGRFCEPVYRLVYALPFGDYLRAPVPQLANWLKAKATLVGTYSFLRDGIRSAAPQNSHVSLYQVDGVPAPAANPPRPPVKPIPLALGVISPIGTVVACRCFFFRRPTGGVLCSRQF